MLKLTGVIFLMAVLLIGHNVVSSDEDDENEDDVELVEYTNAVCKGDKTPTNARTQASIKCSDQALGDCTDKSEDWEVLEIEGCDQEALPDRRGNYIYYAYCSELTNSAEVKHGTRKCVKETDDDVESCVPGNEYSTSSKHTECTDLYLAIPN